MNVALAALAMAIVAANASAEPPPIAPHYDIAMTAAPAQGQVDVDLRLTNISIHAAQPATFLLGGGFNVSESSANEGAAITIAPSQGPGAPQTIVVACPACDDTHRASVHLHYTGIVSAEDGSNVVSPSRLEFSADSLWFPISTNFNTRVLFDMRLTGLSADYVIASPDDVRRTGDAFVFHRTRPSQDIAFSGAPHLHIISDGELHFFSSSFDDPLVQHYLHNGPRALAFLKHLYGPLPTRRAVVSIIDRASGVGYARQGYVALSGAHGANLADDIWANTGYLAHELSHAWWSNADFTSEDYWLVESTAEYSALRFIEAVNGRAERDRLLAPKHARAARGGPILGHGRPSNDAVYAKGPILLFELEDRIGRPALEHILRSLAQLPTITTENFLAELRAIAGPANADWFEAQLRA